MKKLAVGCFLLLAAGLGFLWLRSALAPDETRIRWLLEEMRDGFNASNSRRVLAGLAADFREETEKVDREDVRDYLLYLFVRERDPRTKEFRWRIEMEPQEIQVEADSGTTDRPTARVKVLVKFLERSDARWKEIWTAEVEGDLSRGEVWQIRRARFRSLGGRRPF